MFLLKALASAVRARPLLIPVLALALFLPAKLITASSGALPEVAQVPTLGLKAHRPNAGPSVAGLDPQAPPAKEPQRVEIGIYPNTIYQIDLASHSFYADLYLWLVWEGEIDPSKTLEFMNAVDVSSMSKEVVFEEPKLLPDGRKVQQMRVQGRFFVPFSLSRYPLDRHVLRFEIEDTTYFASQLVYVVDQKNSGLGSIQVPGWDITEWKMSTDTNTYPTNFGDMTADISHGFGRARYDVMIARPSSYFIYKLLIPLVLILLLGWSALLLQPEMVDVRTALPTTALLTAVFLQLTYSASLPEVGYLTLIDKVYLLAYVLILVVLVETIYTANLIQGDTSQTDALKTRIRRFDLLTLLSQVLLFGGGLAGILLS